ncbi:MAG: hypothetical protein ACM3S1_07395 [Hyphomicrobiales bacterium]
MSEVAPSPPPEAPPPQPALPPRPPRIPIRGTVRDAWRIFLGWPRQTILPMAAVQVPVALVTSVVTAISYLTVFKDEPVRDISEIFEDGPSGQLFLMLVLFAVDVLFSQVARGATIVGVGQAARAHRLSLSEALDPAFTRMGGLLLLAIVLGAGAIVLAFTVVGIVVLPYLALKFVLSFEAYMLEGLRPWPAMKRSWALTRGNLISLLGVLVLAALILVGPLLVVQLLGEAVGGSRTMEVILNAVVAFVQTILLVPLLAFLTAVTTMFYLKAREKPDALRPA